MSLEKKEIFESVVKIECPTQFSSVQFSCSVMSDSLLLCGLQHTKLSVHHQLSELAQTLVHRVCASSGSCTNSPSRSNNHLILCHLLLLPPSIFSSIRVFSSESVLCIRCPKYWSFSFSISPSNEY